MNTKTCYLNTDLDLTSADDLTELVKVLEASRIPPLHVGRGKDGIWYATFETEDHYEEPEVNIESMIEVVESLSEHLQSIWLGCLCREFNIGYDCGNEPWAFNQRLSSHLLARISAVGASLRITLYPLEQNKEAKQGANNVCHA